MAGHNLLDFRKKWSHHRKIRRGEIEEEPAKHRLYLRMTLEERLQHGSLALSFILLVITGFMLRFPIRGGSSRSGAFRAGPSTSGASSTGWRRS